MSHDLDETTGKPAMAYVGATPWHGLGEQLPEGQPIETWLEAARLRWKIQMLPVHYPFQGRDRTMDGRFVLARDDTGAALSIVSSDYKIVQPREVLEFYRDLVEYQGYTLETAGALDGGRKVWALARTGLVSNIAGDAADTLGAYLLLATSCDKSIATTATFTSVRVVCQNTLGFAFDDMNGNSRRSIKVDHSRRFDPQPVKTDLGLIDEAWARFLKRVNTMTSYSLDDQSALGYFETLFLSEKEIMEHRPLSSAKGIEVSQIMSLFYSAKGQELSTSKDTLWGAVNAVTNYVDHVRPTKSMERIDSAWFGTGALLKEKAWQRAMDLAEIQQ